MKKINFDTHPSFLDHFQVLGISYKSAEITTREKFSITSDREDEFYAVLEQAGVKNVMFISTCNRTEIYFISETIHPLVDAWIRFSEGSTDELMNAYFHHKGEKALNHLLRVSSGLESQIPGDFEIIMQVRNAFRKAKSLKMANGLFERMLNTAIYTSRRVKTETNFSTGASSVSYATVRYIRDYFSRNNPKILLIGLGEIGRVSLENLLKHYPADQIVIMNRSVEKSIEFAEKYAVQYLPFEDLRKDIGEFQAVVVATGASHIILHKKDIPASFHGLIVDLSVPANVEREVGDIAGVDLLDVDRLSSITRATLDNRRDLVPRVKSIISESQLEFMMWYRKREMIPLIVDMTEQLHQSLLSEFDKVETFTVEQKEQLISRILRRFSADLYFRIEEGVRKAKPVREMLQVQNG